MLDHGPLSDASAKGEILPLYILEPDLWKQPDVSYRHFLHLQHYLSQLDDMFIKRGAKLVIKVGEALPVLMSLATRHNVKAIFLTTKHGINFQKIAMQLSESGLKKTL